eukprot:2109464-Alexandrium_andersonii.AAC.1
MAPPRRLRKLGLRNASSDRLKQLCIFGRVDCGLGWIAALAGSPRALSSDRLREEAQETA